MSFQCYHLGFDGKILERGFWIYLWKITHGKEISIYVGRTGDSSSLNAGSPFTRMSNHLDSNPKAKGNSLWRLLNKNNVDPRNCHFEMLALGPLFPEQNDMTKHRKHRDTLAAIEQKLAKHCRINGFVVLGIHFTKKTLDNALFDKILPDVNLFLQKKAD